MCIGMVSGFRFWVSDLGCGPPAQNVPKASRQLLVVPAASGAAPPPELQIWLPIASCSERANLTPASAV